MGNLIPTKRFYLDDFFDDFTYNFPENQMKCDIYEKDNDYHVKVDIPGFSRENVKVETDNGYLKIEASNSHEEKEEDKDKKYLRRERITGKYQRTFYLGEIDEDRIEAQFKDGVLNILVPKKQKIDTKKIIEIK